MRTSSSVRVLIALAVVTLLASAAPAGVVVVDATGAGDFLDVQSAIDAAADGDVLLIRPGFYPEWFAATVIDKELTLIGDPQGALPTIHALRIQDLSAGKTCVLRGLRIGAPNSHIDSGTGLTLRDNAGSVWVEDCVCAGVGPSVGLGATSPPGSTGVVVQDCAAVTFVRCALNGSRGVDESIRGLIGSAGPGDGGTGARVTGGSRVAFHDCSFRGGDGGKGSYGHGANGGAGLAVEGSTVLVSGGTATGGKGGTNCYPDQIPQWANGGAGATVDATSVVQRRAFAFVGGAPGSDKNGAPGLPGPATIAPASAFVDLVGAERGMAVSAPVREQQTVTLSITGEAHDLVAFLMGFDGGSVPLGVNQGWFLLSGPVFGAFALGSLPAPDGDVVLQFVAPDLTPPSLLAKQFLLQPVFLHASGIAFGAPTAFVLLDASL